MLYEHRVIKDADVPGGWRSVGFHDTKGQYFELPKGDELIHILADDGVNRDTFVRRDNGTLTPVDDWKAHRHEGKVSKDTKKDDLDRGRLNEIMQKAMEPRTFFGKGLELTDYDKIQFKKVVVEAEGFLAPMREDPDWKKFGALIDELNSRGGLISFASHENTFVPTWCIDGGPDAEVKETPRPNIKEGNGLTGIQVPSKVFQIFNFSEATEKLAEYARSTNETIKGRTTDHLGLVLFRVGHYLNMLTQAQEAN